MVRVAARSLFNMDGRVSVQFWARVSPQMSPRFQAAERTTWQTLDG